MRYQINHYFLCCKRLPGVVNHSLTCPPKKSINYLTRYYFKCSSMNANKCKQHSHCDIQKKKKKKKKKKCPLIVTILKFTSLYTNTMFHQQ